jgi:ADP-ribosyl-[dinitrogen reductase] hydrolase
MSAVQTSHTHPLRIDTVFAPGGGQIGMTLCPGKKCNSIYSGVWERDLEIDLRAVCDFGATALVSLIEDHEFDLLGVRDLGDRAEEVGLDWHHLPIRDVDIPDASFETIWHYAGLRLRQILRRGGTVVLHCRAGLGRTGTIAARLLVEMGESTEAAIRAIRIARPGTIETSGGDHTQEGYVRRCRQIDFDENRYDRILGCLLGGAVGDGFGYEVEFQSLDGIRQRFGPAGITEPVFHDGRLLVSDDTQMTLFTLEGLSRADITDGDRVVEEVRRAYLDWLDTQGKSFPGWVPAGELSCFEALRKCRAPGNTCLSALRSGGYGTIENPINDSKGCGGVMRVAPIGLIAAMSPEEVFEIAARVAAITHGHPSGFWSAAAMASVVRMLVDGEGLDRACERSLGLLAGKPDHEETSNAVKAAIDAHNFESFDFAGNVERLGQGWVGEEALGIALYAALCGGACSEVFAIAANHGGDSDSTASIAGQLYGAWRGLSDLPHAWVRRLDILNPLSRLLESQLGIATTVGSGILKGNL